jgi:hypothetical protein
MRRIRVLPGRGNRALERARRRFGAPDVLYFIDG